jgi:hypothetical protein
MKCIFTPRLNTVTDLMTVGRLRKLVMRTLALEARWYRPPNSDLQTPHDRDKIYAVVMGEG